MNMNDEEHYTLPKKREDIKRVVSVGGLTVDLTHTFYDDMPKVDGKTRSDLCNVDIGGGATNFAITTRLLSKIFGKSTHVTLVTKVGDPVPDDITSETTSFIVKTLLKRHKIKVLDSIDNTPYSIPFNAIEEHYRGRKICKAPEKRIEVLAEGLEGTINAIVGAADYVFIDPNKRTISRMALHAANKAGVPVMIDYGTRNWPDDPLLSEIYKEMLEGADLLVVPADAVVEGMTKEDGGELFKRLQEQYGAKTIMMSDGGKPVRILVDGREDEILVEPNEGPLYASGVGDTRDAALLRFIFDGYGMADAMRMATKIASVKVRYPGREWAGHLLDELKGDPLFKHYATLKE